MSSMAKIFVVVNLILGVVAFGSAATLLGAKEDYKAATAKMRTQFEAYKSDMDKKNAALEEEKRTQKDAASQAIAAKANSETRAEDLKGQLSKAEATNVKNTASIEQLTAQVKALTETNKTYATWLAKYAENAKSATTDKVNFQQKWQEEVNNRVRLETEVGKAREENSELAASKGSLDKELRNCKFWLSKYREKYGDIMGASQGQPGVVKAVRGNLVSISVGSDDGVKIGDVYQVRRGGTYVGQITITSVQKDLSIGKFDEEFKGPGAPAQAGDKADPGGY